MKTNKMKKALSFILALTLLLSAGIAASAAEIGTSGGAGSTPVKLTTTNDGLGLNGDGTGTTPAATKLSVTVPTSFPMAMDEDGNVITASDCKIINNSYGAVRVKTVTISSNEEDGWKLTAFGDKNTLSSEKVDSKKLGFKIKLGDGNAVLTGTTGNTQTLISTPVTGCYLSGAGDSVNSVKSVSYEAIVTPFSSPVTEATTVASVVFVVEWDR